MAPTPPSEKCECGDSTACSCSEPEPIIIRTPAKRKSSTNNTPTPGKRKVSNTPNESRTPVTARKVTTTVKFATPIRKTSAQNAKTPNSAPARARPGVKKGEPTLIGDFLRGRPSPARQKAARRRSLDAVKAEMREGNVRSVQAPGKVQDRVRQWQRNGAAVAIADPNIDEIVVIVESDSEDGPDKAERLRVKSGGKRKSKSPIPEERARRRIQEGKEHTPTTEPRNEDERARSKSIAPKKRVISDSHWMKNKRSPPRKTTAIPKNFLQATATNPPVERKIEDWVRRTAETVEIPVKIQTPKRKPRKIDRDDSEEPPSRKASRSPCDDGIRVSGSKSTSRDDSTRIKPSKDRPAEDSSWVTSSRGGSNDDGIRVKPLDVPEDEIKVKFSKPHSYGDGFRVRLSRDKSVQEDVQIKPVRKDGSKRRPKGENESPTPTPRKKSETHLKPPAESEERSRVSSHATLKTEEEDDKSGWVSPSPPEKSKRKNRKSDTNTATESLDEIPVGNSAFSVLDLALGAEPDVVKRPAPKRNPSFGVQKVLKKVYNEGMKIMHDNHEPVRGGPNQPPSIDSWLNGTSDPFMDGTVPTDGLGISNAYPSRMPSYKEDDKSERELSRTHQGDRVDSRRRPSRPKVDEDAIPAVSTPPKTRGTLSSMDYSPPISPGGLKRTPATHKTASPKSGRKLFSKEGIFDAFKGESAMARKKDDGPSPFDFIGMREQDRIVSAQGASTVDSCKSVSEEPQRKVSTRVSESPDSGGPTKINVASFPRRPGPMTGANRLSTIASVETFETLSSVTTESQLSETTVTQDTLLTAPTLSSLSRGSTKPRRKRSTAKTVEKSKVGSKRGLTKHSDLLSMLSLPDTTQPGRADSIRPARSVRTNRVNLETATVQDLMREVAEDETKYMRELNTLVDGVIPVLLTCVLSKNDAAIAAGLFNPLASTTSMEDPSFTKPIVDMGIALERLKSLHKRIPLADADAFLYWAESAQKTYREYLVAWRTGFQDVVVNLEPASPSSSPEKMDGEMRRDKNGDVIRDNGERADVAYLLKRPLVRVKFLARATKGLDRIKKSKLAKEIREMWDKLEIFARSRAKEEAGRREDLDAASTDPTRARDPKTMAPIEGVRIDPSLQVIAKDTFSLDIRHSSGQRMECQVEFILRKSPDRRLSDVLICAFDNTHRYLLFPPISKSHLSSRKGDSGQQLIVMIRSGDEKDHWHELLILGTDDDEASGFWVKELGTLPLVPTITEIDIAGSSQALLTAAPSSALTVPAEKLPTTAPVPTSDDVPIGQRRRREEESADSPSPRRLPSYRRRGPVASGYDRLGEEALGTITEYNVLDFKDLNDAMTKAGYAPVKKLKPRGPNPTKRATPSRYHKPKDTLSSNGGLTLIDMSGDKNFPIEMSGALNPYPEVATYEEFDTAVDHRAGSPDYSLYDCMDLPYIPKKRASSASSVSGQPSTPLRETMRPEIQSLKKPQLDTPVYADSPPPVPAHRTPSTPDILKNIPVIEPTPRNKNRRGSSPLKHEYQPSEESGASGTSSCNESGFESESDSSTASSGSYSDSSDDELEAIDEEEIFMPAVLPRAQSNRKRPSPEGSVYSTGTESLAPSNSASQGPYTTRVPSNGTIIDPLTADLRTFAAAVSFWNGKKGKWEDIYPHPDQTCSIQVSPGLVQVFQIDSDHSSPNKNVEKEDQTEGPLVALGLTPLVPLRQSTMIDIEVTSPPLESSRLKQSQTVRFRSMNERDCKSFYHALHRARLDNPAWKKLERDRTVASYGNRAYEHAVAPSRRSWFGRKKSYRAPDRAPSEIASEQSGNSSPSARSALRRLGGGGLFNIAKSSIHDKRNGGRSNPGSGPTSMYTTESSEYSSGVISPRSPSLANSGSMYSNGLAVRNIGSENLKIRLYRGATSSRWLDMGEALLTIGDPLPGQRHASSLNHGVLKRIFVVKAQPDEEKSLEDDGNSSKTRKEAVIWLDVVLGSRNFMKYGRNGIAFQIWEDITGDDGMLGGVPAIGGVSGRTRKWMFQTQRAGDCIWIYNLVGGS